MNDKQLRRSSAALLFSNVMVGLEGTIIATALPSMMAELHGIQLMSWVIAIFMLMMAVTAPIWTKLSERFGYKRLFILGSLIFIIASLIEGLSVSMPMLIFARALMGIGAGAMQQLPFVIYGVLFESARRRKAVGNAISAYSIAAVAGPLLGGAIVGTLGWRWVFFINIPIGLAMIAVVARNFHHDYEPNIKAIDYAGSTLLSAGVIFLMLALQFLGNTAPDIPLIITFLVLSLAIFIIFYLVEKRAKDPVIPLELFKNRALMSRNIMMFLQYGFFGFYSNYLPTWGQGPLGMTAFIGGIILVPSSVFLMISTQLINRLIARFSEKSLVSTGYLFMLAGGALLIALPAHASVFWLMLAAALFGIAFGLTNTVLQVSVQEVVQPEYIGAATALNALIRTLGTTLVLSGLSVSLNLTFSKAIVRNHDLSFSLINEISDSNAVHNISSTLVKPLRLVMYQGLHNLAIIGLIIIAIAAIINVFTSWKKAQAN